MALELRQSTAGQEIPLGFFVDSSDGDTEETGLSIANTDIKIWKWGATTLANKNSGGATHISNGIYYCTLDATDTNTLGPLEIFVHVAGALVCHKECAVVDSNYWDTKYSSSYFQVDTIAIDGSQESLGDLKDFADNGYDSTSHKVQGLVLADTCTTNSDMRGTDSAALASVCTEGRLSELDAANLPSDVDAILVDTGTTLEGHLTDIKGTGFVKDTHSLTDITEDVTGLNGDAMRGTDNAATASALTTHDGKLDTVDTVVDAIKSKTDSLPADPASETNVDANETKIDTIDTIVDAIKAKTDSLTFTTANKVDSRVDYVGGTSVAEPADLKATTVDLNADQSGVTIGTVNTLTGHTAQTGDNYARLGAPAGASVSADIANVKSQIGTAGNGLTNMPWNASWDAEVQSEVQEAIEANNLDHLMKVAVANNADMTAEVADGSVLSNIMSKTSDTSSFTVGDDSLEAISDATGGSGVNVTQIKGTNLTETNAGDLANNISQFFDVNPTTTKDVDDVGAVASGGVPRLE